MHPRRTQNAERTLRLIVPGVGRADQRELTIARADSRNADLHLHRFRRVNAAGQQRHQLFALFNRGEQYPVLYADRTRKRIMLGKPWRGPRRRPP